MHAWVIHACNLQHCSTGSLAWASDPARTAGSSPTTWAALDPAQKNEWDCWFSPVFILWFVLYCKNINLLLKYPVFYKTLHIYIYMQCFVYIAQKMLCFHAYGQYPKKYFEHFLIKKQIFEVLKMCFRMDFLNTKKNMGNNLLLFSINIWIKKPKWLISKILI